MESQKQDYYFIVGILHMIGGNSSEQGRWISDYANGTKVKNISLHWSSIYKLGPTSPKLDVVVRDMVGNEAKICLDAPPTIPYAPSLTEAVANNSDVFNLSAISIAATKMDTKTAKILWAEGSRSMYRLYCTYDDRPIWKPEPERGSLYWRFVQRRNQHNCNPSIKCNSVT